MKVLAMYAKVIPNFIIDQGFLNILLKVPPCNQI